MSDFSWPVFYRLSIKNEDKIPQYVIPGRTVRIQLNLVNELDAFRGDDIFSECPIPLRATAIPIENGTDIDPVSGEVINHHEIATEVCSKRVSLKPVIERGGQGNIILDFTPQPPLARDEKLMFVIEIGISPACRLFNLVLPVCTAPLTMVSPNSTHALILQSRAKQKQLEQDASDDDDEEEEEPEHDEEAAAEEGTQEQTTTEHDHKHHKHDTCCSGHDHHHHHNHHTHSTAAQTHPKIEIDDQHVVVKVIDESSLPQDFDLDGAEGEVVYEYEYVYQDGEGEEHPFLFNDGEGELVAPFEGEDGLILDDGEGELMYEDEDDEFDHEHDLQSQLNAVYQHDADLYEPAVNELFWYQRTNNDNIPQDEVYPIYDATLHPTTTPQTTTETTQTSSSNDAHDSASPHTELHDVISLDLPGSYHSVICDPFIHVTINPHLSAIAEQIASQHSIEMVPFHPNMIGLPLSRPTATTAGASMGLQVQGARHTQPASEGAATSAAATTARPVVARPTVARPAVTRPVVARPGAAARPAVGKPSASSSSSAQTTNSAVASTDNQFPTLGLKQPGAGAALFRNIQQVAYPLLHPVNGFFANTPISASLSALRKRQTMALASVTYLKVIRGNSIGGRIWDGALYLINFLYRLWQQTPLSLDHLRMLELGSGTGIVGLWMWGMLEQRLIAQMKHISQRFNVDYHAVECVFKAMTLGDLSTVHTFYNPPSTHIHHHHHHHRHNDGDDHHHEHHEETPIIRQVTIPARVYLAAATIIAFVGDRKSCMIVTDHTGIMPLLTYNAQLNTSKKLPILQHRAQTNSIFVDFNSTQDSVTLSISSECDESIPQHSLASTPVTGLHSLPFDWNVPLTKALYKTCGVYLPVNTSTLFDDTSLSHIKLPVYTAQHIHPSLRIDSMSLPASLSSQQITWMSQFESISQLNAPLYAPLRSVIKSIYTMGFDSLPNHSPLSKLTGLEECIIPTSRHPDAVQRIRTRSELLAAPAAHSPHDAIAPQTISQVLSQSKQLLPLPPTSTSINHTNNTSQSFTLPYRALPGLDAVLVVECLYNDRYFNALKNSIIRILHAHFYAYAQKQYLWYSTIGKQQSTTSSVSPMAPPPQLELPIFILSYRFRALHEEQLIHETFFQPLREEYNIFHTEIALSGVLGTSMSQHDTSRHISSHSDNVAARQTDRQHRINEIRNALAELDADRQNETRFALLYFSPGVTTASLEEHQKHKVIAQENPSDDALRQAAYDISRLQIVSPLPFMHSNAAFFFKLFQRL